MSQLLQDIRSQFVKLWQGLGQSQRIALVLGGAGAVALIVAVVTWARTPEYATVFSNLSEADAAAIVAKLKEGKTPYELANGGTAIKVPSATLYDTRLEIASSGLPQGGTVGFELFNQANFGMTDFAQKVNYQRALEGELSRTINRLGPVEQSRVHVVIPQPSLFSDNQKDASASVLLKLRPGQRLSQSQIEGIAHLVSSSVEGLKPQNLTIVDASGNVLSDGQSAGKDQRNVSTALLQAEGELAADLEQKAQAMLNRVLGAGKANVRVSAVMDWDQFESNSEIYSPGSYQPQVRSSRVITEWQTGEGSQGGVPGVASNIPGYAGVLTSTSSLQGQTGKQDSTVNYELSKTVEKLSRAPGKIKRLSVAVVLDGAQPIEPERIDSLSKLVSAAVGVDPARGDTLVVSSIPFDRSSLVEEANALEQAQQRDAYLEQARIGAMALGPLLLLMSVFLLLRRRHPRRVTSFREVRENARQLANPSMVSSVEGPQLAKAMISEPARPAARLDAKVSEVSASSQQVTLLAMRQPETMAKLIRAWLEEDGNN